MSQTHHPQRETPILENKVAVITGASRGIGRAIAHRLARSGCDLFLNFLTSEAKARELADELQSLNRRVWLVKADMGEEEDIAEMMEFAGQQAGRIDMVISNAASGGFRPLQNASMRHFDTAMHTNARALLLLAQHAVKWMQGSGQKGKIVALSSHGSHRALPAYGLVGASKAALESLVRQLAFELGPQGVNVNCVLAGLVATDAVRHVDGFDDIFARNQARMLVADQRTLTPEDVADAVHFLCSPAADLIQGHTLVIDGGVSLHL